MLGKGITNSPQLASLSEAVEAVMYCNIRFPQTVGELVFLFYLFNHEPT